ncbi:MAG: 3-isopropylmalate dehydratase small subunit [Thermoplasmata archaeon]|nr:3-isopropylmalate dehydratase small subunit [Thermoplasmata archaeon]
MPRAWKYGDDVNTDVIFPGKYTYTISDPKEMAEHALEDLDPDFAGNVREGDIVVAGKNFGCGSSREQAAVCLKAAGVSAVVAKSFARIFYRNAINAGLPAVVCEGVDSIEHGDEVEIDLKAGKIINRTKGVEIGFTPIPDFMMEIIEDGGLLPHLKKQLNR